MRPGTADMTNFQSPINAHVKRQFGDRPPTASIPRPQTSSRYDDARLSTPGGLNIVARPQSKSQSQKSLKQTTYSDVAEQFIKTDGI